jgi:CDP-ribitol ribitolphosphotransferase
MRLSLVLLRAGLVRLAFAVSRRLPLRRRVVLANGRSAQLSGNLAFIRAELLRREPPIPHVVLTHRLRRGLRGRLAAIGFALRSGYHLATARLFVVDDYFFPIYVVRPRPGTTIVQVWHASGAFKKMGYSVLDKSFGADEKLVSRVPIHANYDLCLVSSASVIPHYVEAFRQPAERFTARLGIPRSDLLFDDVDRRAAEIRSRYRLDDGRRVILYAPTFRGDSVTDARFDATLDLSLLAERLAADHVLLLRLHPFVRSRVRIGPELAHFVVDASDHPDINALMLASDLLVTDYSSAIFEFALLGRPILFFAPDHAAYERERGFYLDLRSDLPGPIFETTAELAEHIRRGSFDTERVQRFARASFDVADGHASERFVDAVVLPALDGEPLRVGLQDSL